MSNKRQFPYHLTFHWTLSLFVFILSDNSLFMINRYFIHEKDFSPDFYPKINYSLDKLLKSLNRFYRNGHQKKKPIERYFFPNGS